MSLAKVVFFDLDVPQHVEGIQNKVIRYGQFGVNHKNVLSNWQIECNLKHRQGNRDLVKFHYKCTLATIAPVGYTATLNLLRHSAGNSSTDITPLFNAYPLKIYQFNETTLSREWEISYELDKFLRSRASFFPEGKLKCQLQIFSHDLECSIRVNETIEMGDLQMFDYMIQAPANVTLKTHDGFEIKVNMEILSMASDVFTTMFTTDMTEATNGVVQIKEFSHEVIHELMSFIYCKKVKKDISRINFELFRAAHAYNIKDLFNTCLVSIIDNLKYDNVIYTAAFADIYELKQLFAICCERIYLMWPRISIGQEWKEQSSNELKTKIINEIMKRTMESQIEEKTAVIVDRQQQVFRGF